MFPAYTPKYDDEWRVKLNIVYKDIALIINRGSNNQLNYKLYSNSNDY